MRVGIIGGGAAGLFAGCFLKKQGADFTVLEKGPECGRKLVLTGHGRCNITNRKPARDLKAGYHEASNFIYPAISSFTPDDAVKFIEDELGVPLKEEENNRMFPVSEKASDIRDALVKFIGKDNIRTGFDVTDISLEEGAFKVVSSEGESLTFDRIILATGGKSFAKTGSDGSGFKLAGRLGHKVTELAPALAPVKAAGSDREFTSSVSGVSVDADAGLYLGSKKQTQTHGSVLFTHDGLSGPAVTELARYIPSDVVSSDGWIELDFMPGRTDTEVDEELLREINDRPDTKLTTIGAGYVPSSLSSGLGKRAGVTDLYAAKVTRENRKSFLKELKHCRIKIASQSSFDTAFVTRGGVELKEISRKTLESSIVPGLYFIGEILDVDGISGGYNLQAAMSGAYIAAHSIMC